VAQATKTCASLTNKNLAVARMADRTAQSNPNPNAGPARVRRHLGARPGGRTGDNLAKTDTSP